MTQMQHCSRWLIFATNCVFAILLPVRLPAPQSHCFAVHGCLVFLCSSWSTAPNLAGQSSRWPLCLACLSFPRLSLSSRNWDQQSAFWTGLPSKSRFWAVFPHFYPVTGQIASPHKPLIPAPSVKGYHHHCQHKCSFASFSSGLLQRTTLAIHGREGRGI